MDADQNNRSNHVQSHQNEDPILQLPPSLQNLPRFEELRRAIEEELQREEMATAFEAQVQAPDGVPLEFATNRYPPPSPPPPPPPSPQNHAAEGENLVFHPDTTNNGYHSPQATSTNNGHLPPPPDGPPLESATNSYLLPSPPPPLPSPQNHAAEGGNLVFHPDATNNGYHSLQAASKSNGHPPPPPQDHAAKGGLMVDFESGNDSDVNDVLPTESIDG